MCPDGVPPPYWWDGLFIGSPWPLCGPSNLITLTLNKYMFILSSLWLGSYSDYLQLSG